MVLDKLGEAKPLDKKDNIGLSNKEARDFSIVRAIKAMTTGNWSGAELEKEASDEISRKTGKAPRGIFIPSDGQADPVGITLNNRRLPQDRLINFNIKQCSFIIIIFLLKNDVAFFLVFFIVENFI